MCVSASACHKNCVPQNPATLYRRVLLLLLTREHGSLPQSPVPHSSSLFDYRLAHLHAMSILGDADLVALDQAVFAGLPAEDKARWFNEGFRFNADAPLRFGLRCVQSGHKTHALAGILPAPVAGNNRAAHVVSSAQCRASSFTNSFLGTTCQSPGSFTEPLAPLHLRPPTPTRASHRPTQSRQRLWRTRSRGSFGRP